MKNIPNQETLAAALNLIEIEVAQGKWPFVNIHITITRMDSGRYETVAYIN